MNRFDPTGPGGEATLRYLDGEFQVVRPGNFVRCAVTGRVVPLDELRYWSVARQEPYADAKIAYAREVEMASRGQEAGCRGGFSERR